MCHFCAMLYLFFYAVASPTNLVPTRILDLPSDQVLVVERTYDLVGNRTCSSALKQEYLGGRVLQHPPARIASFCYDAVQG